MTLLTLAQDDSGTLAEEAYSLVQALPIEAHVALGLLFVGGLLLWLFGGKIIKPIFGLAGMVVGASVGLIALPAFGLEAVGGAPASLIGLICGAVIGLVIALIALKAAIVVAAGLGLAAVGFMGGSIYLSQNPLPDDGQPAAFEREDDSRSSTGRLLFENPYTGEKMTLSELTSTLREADSFLGGGLKATGGDEEADSEQEARLRAIAARCEAIVREGYDLAKSYWNALTSRERLVVVGSTFGGLALGLFVGFFMPKKSSAFITALTGSGLMLASGAMLLDAYMPGARPMLDRSAIVWAGIWGFAFMLGLIVQLAGLGKSSGGGKKAEKSDDGDDEEDEE